MRLRCIALLLTAAAAVSAEQPLDRDFRIFLDSFEGEFNNFHQVDLERSGTLERPVSDEDQHPWHHHTVRRVDAPRFGDHVFFAQIRDAGPQGEVVRQSVHVLEPASDTGTIEQRFYAVPAALGGPTFDPDSLRELAPEDLRGYPAGCVISWRRQVDQFIGQLEPGACQVVSRRSGTPMFIVAEMVLADRALWHSEGGTNEQLEPLFGPPGGVPFKLRRVRYFTCRVAVRDEQTTGDRDVVRDVRIHDQGGFALFTTTGTDRRQYFVQLNTFPAPNGSRHDVLELSVHQGVLDPGRPNAVPAVGSSSAAASSDLIGIDLGWMHASCSVDDSSQ